jgi:hypothetical protein
MTLKLRNLDPNPGSPNPIPEPLADALKIDDLALNEEFIRFPGDLAYWGARCAEAHERFMLQNYELERVRARLWLEIREEAEAGERKARVDDIECEIVLRDEYRDAHIAKITAEANHERLKKFWTAVAAKKEMLIGLGATQRLEMERDPVIRDQHRYAHRNR